MLKRLFTVIALCVGMQSAHADVPEFSDADWAAIPAPGDITLEEVRELFEGPIVMNNHTWELGAVLESDTMRVMKGGPFIVRTPLEDGKLFMRQPFKVDSAGVIRYELMLVSIKPIEEKDGGERFNMAKFSISTQLTAAELSNPIIKAIQSSMTFKEKFELQKTDMRLFRKTIHVENLRSLMMFVLPERRAEIAAAIEEAEAARTADL